MTIEEFKVELSQLLEKVRVDTMLGKHSREIVINLLINLLAPAIIIGHRSGVGRRELVGLFEFLLDNEYGPPESPLNPVSE